MKSFIAGLLLCCFIAHYGVLPSQAQTLSFGCTYLSTTRNISPPGGLGSLSSFDFLVSERLIFTITEPAPNIVVQYSLTGDPLATIATLLTPGVRTVLIPFSGLSTQLVWSLSPGGTIGCAAPAVAPPPGTDTPEQVAFFIDDRRLNKYDIAALVAIYANDPYVDVYAIDPATGAGDLIIHFDVRTLPAEAPASNQALASGTNPHNGDLATLYRLTTGEFQVNAPQPDDMLYTFIWDPDELGPKP